jgi:hypothetical protein
MKGTEMARLGLCFLLIACFGLACGQMQVPGATVDLKPLQDSLALHQTRIATLQAQLVTAQAAIVVLTSRPTYSLNGDTLSYLSGTGIFKKGAKVIVKDTAFTGVEWKMTVAFSGINTGWLPIVVPIYSSDTATYDWPVGTIVGSSVVIRRRVTGTVPLTANLPLKILLVSP